MLGSDHLEEYNNFQKILNCYEEVKSRNSPIIFISNSRKLDQIKNKLIIPSNSSYQDLLTVIPLQIISLILAKRKNINPDQPRNLAKVVTVE